MCIHTEETRLRTADKNIIVYKIILVYTQNKARDVECDLNLLESPNDYVYRAFYRYVPIGKECVEERFPYKGRGIALPLLSHLRGYRYGEGLIHSFKTKKDAISTLEKGYTHMKNGIIYKCIIPKGTEYVSGINEEFLNTYAAKEIVFEKPVYFGSLAKEWHDRIIRLKEQ